MKKNKNKNKNWYKTKEYKVTFLIYINELNQIYVYTIFI